MRSKLLIFIGLVSFLFISFELQINALTCSESGVSCARPTLPYEEGVDYIVRFGDIGELFGNTIVRMKRQNSVTDVFCLIKGKPTPTYGTSEDYTKYTCSTSYSIDNGLKAGIGYAINWFNSSSKTDIDYGITQVAIHKFLSDYGKSAPPSLTGASTTYTSLYNNMKTQYNAYKNASLRLNSSTLSFTKSGEYWVSYITVTPNYVSSYNYELLIGGSKNNSYVEKTGDTYKVKIPKDSVSSGTRITFNVTSTRDYYMAQTKSCGSKRQPIAEVSVTTETKNYSASATGTISGTSSSSNSCDTELQGTKDWYRTRKLCYQCSQIYSSPADIWSCKQSCFLTAEDRKQAYISALFGLYARYPEFANLLKFSNFSDASCSEATCGVKDEGCFSGSFDINNTFDKNNLSCYTDKIDLGGKTAYCLTTFKFTNLVGNYWHAKSGQSIFASREEIDVIGVTLDQECYVRNGSVRTSKTESYFDYIRNFTTSNQYTLKNTESYTEPINLKFVPNNAPMKLKYNSSCSGNGFTCYTASLRGNYKLSDKIYIENGSGLISPTYCKNCKFLGYGLVSKLNQFGDSKISLKFDFETNSYGTVEYEGICEYSVASELIGSRDEKDYMNLEFRIVNTNSDNLFLSKDGTSSREPRANWKRQEDILKNNNNSYNKDHKDPLYTITLTPAIMKDIKNYNKDNAYDDYNLDCKNNGTVCISNYLTTLRSNNILEINNSKKRACYEDNDC